MQYIIILYNNSLQQWLVFGFPLLKSWSGLIRPNSLKTTKYLCSSVHTSVQSSVSQRISLDSPLSIRIECLNTPRKTKIFFTFSGQQQFKESKYSLSAWGRLVWHFPLWKVRWCWTRHRIRHHRVCAPEHNGYCRWD